MILIEMPRRADLRSSIGAPWGNLQRVIGIVERYQGSGLLCAESPLATVSALLGPVMIGQMFRRANLDLPVPTIDPTAHVEAFLRGRAR